MTLQDNLDKIRSNIEKAVQAALSGDCIKVGIRIQGENIDLLNAIEEDLKEQGFLNEKAK